jgi:hypothetical protein
VQSPANLGRLFDPLANDSDPGADPFRLVSVTAPAHGTATLAVGGAGIIYVPVLNFTGADSFSYVVSDGDGGTAIGTISVDVVSTLPPPPSATPDLVTLQGTAGSNAGATIIFDPRLNDADPLGKWLRIVDVSQPLGGTVEIINNGTGLRISSIGSGSEIGLFTYTVQDGVGRQASATITAIINLK